MDQICGSLSESWAVTSRQSLTKPDVHTLPCRATETHCGPVIVCAPHDSQPLPSQPHRHTGPTFMKTPLVCLCMWVHVCECGRRVCVKSILEIVIFRSTLLQAHNTLVKMYSVRCVVPSSCAQNLSIRDNCATI